MARFEEIHGAVRALLIVAALGSGCTYSDSERCPKGMFFAEEVFSCCVTGDAIFYPDSQRCHRFSEKSSENCPTKGHTYFSFSYKNEDREPVQVSFCCSPETTFYSNEECEEPVVEEPKPEPDTSSDTGVDNEPPSGQGQSCTKDGKECDGYDADYCAVNPVAPDDAYCTTSGCQDSKSCENGYACCDCTSSPILPQVSACLKDKDAKLAGSVASCDCDI